MKLHHKRMRHKAAVRLRPTSMLAFGLAFVFTLTASTSYLTAFASPPANPVYDPVRSCESLTSTIISEGTDNSKYTVSQAVTDPGDQTHPASCKVHAVSTHPPAGDTVNIWIWLPANDWNGRFMGTGGSGFSGGSVNALATPVSQGYAAGATDTGHVGGNGSYILKADGSLNWQLLRDDKLGVHEMTVAGKALAKAFYDKQPRYAYFNGCSTGGR